MEDTFLQQVLNWHKQNNWHELLKLKGCKESRKLAWVWPSKDNLKFIKEVVEECNLSGIISIGCGCGIFEWILQQATDLPVTGYEVNQEWWMSKYCSPQFIQLKFPELPPTEDILNPKFALLFCYFNDGAAFRQYVNCYKGNLVFIVGPGPGTGRHTEPEPFHPNFDPPTWTLHHIMQVDDTGDFIGAYIRR